MCASFNSVSANYLPIIKINERGSSFAMAVEAPHFWEGALESFAIDLIEEFGMLIHLVKVDCFKEFEAKHYFGGEHSLM